MSQPAKSKLQLWAASGSPCRSAEIARYAWSSAELRAELCVLQVEGEGLVSQPAYSKLHAQLWSRQWQALQRCKPAAAGQATAQRAKAEKSLEDLTSKPAHVAGCPLHPHQLQASCLSG